MYALIIRVGSPCLTAVRRRVAAYTEREPRPGLVRPRGQQVNLSIPQPELDCPKSPFLSADCLLQTFIRAHLPPLPLLRLELLPCQSVVSARCPVVRLPGEIDKGGSCAAGAEDAVSEMDVVYEALLCMIDV
ncbi:hypothetical protein SRHO_G00001070 [Serrasalmus rhombeus]